MKKIFMSASFSLGMIFTVQAQTIEELPINKSQNAPEFKITYPAGKVAYVDMHKLYPPTPNPNDAAPGTKTVGFVSDFDPMQNDQFKENARIYAWNTDYLVPGFEKHLGSHETQLGINVAQAKTLVNKVHQRALERLGL